MNIFSILRLSLHNLWNNKLRTLLTVVVLTVVSFVVVLLIGVGYSFYASVNANVNEAFQKDISMISIRSEFDNKDGQYYRSSYLTLDQTEKILGIIDDDGGCITSVGFIRYDSYNKNFDLNGVSAYDSYNEYYSVAPYYAKSNPFVGIESFKDSGYLAAGRMWNASDEGSNNCWLSKSAMSKYKLGDEITFSVSVYNGSDMPATRDVGTFTVAGFLNVDTWQTAAFIDYKQFNDTPDYSTSNDGYDRNYTKMLIRSVYATMVPQEGFSYGMKTRKQIESLLKRVEAEVAPTTTEKIEASCDTLEMMQLAMILGAVVIGALVFVSLVIIMLSIGSVANTIKISAEQNRKFFGVMKAIGMKNKSLRHILIGQIVIMTVVSVAIASLAAYLTVGVASNVLRMLVSVMFMSDEPMIICGISPVIPVAVALLLMGFVLLFTRSSLHEFSRMDVISVINEVN